jgi:hypothetical protein
MRDKRGLQDGNDREATIARWLKNEVLSERVTELVLTARCGDEAENIIARWPRERVHRDLAPEINALVQDFANDNGTTCNAHLTWMTAEGQPWTSKGFRARCSAGTEETVRPLDASNVSLIQQLQRHLEASNRLLVDFVDRSDARWERMFERIDKQAVLAEERAQAALEQAEQLEEAAQNAIALAEEATEQAEQAKAAAEAAADDDKLAKVLDIAGRQLMAGG